MSNLERDFLKAKLGKLPLVPASFNSYEDEDEEELQDSLGSLSHQYKPRASTSKTAYTPLSGSAFFGDALSVSLSDNSTFRVYFSAPHSKDPDDPYGTLLVCHHGAGYSGLSFARFAESMKEMDTKGLGILALDARGHGKSKASDEKDLSLERLSSDLVAILKELYPDRSKAPKILLVGHSMGGAVVVDACSRIQQDVASVTGVVVLDIVEGSAMEALSAMTGLIQSRPQSFSSTEEAIAWHISSKTLHNAESARVSIPPLLVEDTSSKELHWRTDLSSTEPFWTGWYANLSKRFLNARAAKLLVLAGTDRLDTELTIGQMQGKYQMTVFTDVGHCIQEDAPRRLAALVLDFWKRNDTHDILKNVRKVGQY